MAYLALYRRFRPNTFDKMVGQEHVVQTLINQIKTDRVGHAYLFCGARGTGKTSAAKIFARAINCLSPVNGSPCGECAACKALADPANLDILEIDAASNNKVENVREIRDKAQYPPVAVRYKAYIIDEVHMLTTEAFNALLKTLEEPPKHVVFILATTEPHKLPATILSRCMRFDFRLVPEKTIATLVKGVYDELGRAYEEEAITAIARAGEGSVRDALSVADLCVSCPSQKLSYDDVIGAIGASGSRITAELCEHIFKGETGATLETIDKLVNLGKGVGVLARDVCALLRSVTIVKTCGNAKSVLGVPDGEYAKIEELAALTDVQGLLRASELFASAEGELKYSTHPRIVFETAATKASMPSADYNIDALLSRVNKLEKQVAALTKRLAEQPVLTLPTEEKKQIKTAVEDKTETPSVNAEAKPERDKSFEKAAEAKPVFEEKAKRGFDEGFEGLTPPPEEASALPLEQVPRGGYVKPSSAVKSAVAEEKKPEIVQTTIAEPPKPVEEKKKPALSDARVWGTVVRRLRADKNIMLWIACQDLEARAVDGKLRVIAEGDNEYNVIQRPENLRVLQDIVSEISDYKIEIYHSGEVKSGFEEDYEKLKETLGNVEIVD